MLEQFEDLGVWWIPSDPNRKLTGTLTFSPQSGANLELVGYFEADRSMHLLETNRLIYGLTTQFGAITLSGCRGEGVSVKEYPHTESLNTSRYRAERLFVGLHLRDLEAMRIPEISLSMTDLHDWFGKRRLSFDDETGQGDSSERIIKYRRPDPVDIVIGSIAISFRSWVTRNTTGDDMRLRGTSEILMRYEEGMTLDEWLDRAVYPLHQFVSFARGRATGISTITFEHEYPGEELAAWPPKSVSVHFLVSANMRYEENKSHLPRYMHELVNFETVESDGDSVLVS